LIDRGLKADPSEKKVAELAGKVASAWELELRAHFQVEEEILFPAVRPVLVRPEIVDELIAQHRELENLIQRIPHTSGQARMGLLIECGERLSRHIRLEERQLFEEIQQRLPAHELKELGRRIDETVQRTCPITHALPWEGAGPGESV
jgi:hemerythrin-like domain-containing protein